MSNEGNSKMEMLLTVFLQLVPRAGLRGNKEIIFSSLFYIMTVINPCARIV